MNWIRGQIPWSLLSKNSHKVIDATYVGCIGGDSSIFLPWCVVMIISDEV